MAETKTVDIGAEIRLRKAIFALEQLKDCSYGDCQICPLTAICLAIVQLKDALREKED